jgi:uncharacterized RDD family membrane protein YckC
MGVGPDPGRTGQRGVRARLSCQGAASVVVVTRPSGDPRPGAGGVAGFGQRFLAFLVDGAIADVIAIAVNGGYHVGGRQNLAAYLAFLLLELVFVGFVGQTPGMRVVGIGVARADGAGRAGLGWVAVRTLLLAALIPAIITDATGRAMHDRAAGTVTVRTR